MTDFYFWSIKWLNACFESPLFYVFSFEIQLSDYKTEFSYGVNSKFARHGKKSFDFDLGIEKVRSKGDTSNEDF